MSTKTNKSIKKVTSVQTPIGRFSYPFIFDPRPNNLKKVEIVVDGKKQIELVKEYSIDILFDKETDLSKVQEAINNAIENKFGADVPKNLRLPLKDGDVEKPTDHNYKGKLYLTAKKTYDPKNKNNIKVFIGSTKNPTQELGSIVGGDYGVLALNFYGFDAAGNKGIGVSLEGVLLTKKGEPFSGAVPAEEIFSSYAEDVVFDEQNADLFDN